MGEAPPVSWGPSTHPPRVAGVREGRIDWLPLVHARPCAGLHWGSLMGLTDLFLPSWGCHVW